MKTRYLTLAGMIIVTALFRLIPHAPNFTPIVAIALFGGAMLQDKRLALLMPLAAMLLSDLIIGFHATMPYVYAGMVGITILGFGLAAKKSAGRVLGATCIGAILFFVVSNFGVWATMSLYPKTMAGLGACYVAAIPFFGQTLLSSVVYAGALFGGFALVEKRVPALANA